MANTQGISHYTGTTSTLLSLIYPGDAGISFLDSADAQGVTVMLARTLTHLPDAGMQTSAFLVALYQGQGKITRLDSLTEPFKVWMSSPLDVWVTDQFTLQAYRVSPYLP